ncbi:hypothetical protein L7F22_049727 [Adiantum nelumboides]|nr:hypothetical protein [Adiantum nelumboides]
MTVWPCPFNDVRLQVSELRQADFQGAKWIMLDGYGLYGEELVERIMDLAKQEDVQVAMDLFSFLLRYSMSVHAYITHCQNHEAILEEKRRCKNGDEGPSKRAARIGGKNDAKPCRAPPTTEEAPSPEVTVEESATVKKKESTKGRQKGPAYKLQFDIELATDLKESILNSKVEFTLGQVLGIAKHEFHEEITNIIKRKRQMLGEAICPQVEEDL